MSASFSQPVSAPTADPTPLVQSTPSSHSGDVSLAEHPADASTAVSMDDRKALTAKPEASVTSADPAVTSPQRRPPRRDLPPPPEKSSKRTSVLKARKPQEALVPTMDPTASVPHAKERADGEDVAPKMSIDDRLAAEAAGLAIRDNGSAAIEADKNLKDSRLSLYSHADSDSRQGLTQYVTISIWRPRAVQLIISVQPEYSLVRL